MQQGPSLGIQHQLQPMAEKLHCSLKLAGSDAKEEGLEVYLDDLVGIRRWILINDQMQQPFFLYIRISFNSRSNHPVREVTWTLPVERIWFEAD